MNEEVIDREGNEAALIKENYAPEIIEVSLENEPMEQDSQEYVSESLKPDGKISGENRGCKTSDSEKSEKHQAYNLNFCTEENITVAHVRNKEKTFTNLSMKKELGIEHYVKKHTCEYCQKTFTKANSKRCHLKFIHKVKFPGDEEPSVEKRTCEYCQKIFTRLRYKRLHLKTVHKVESAVSGNIRCVEVECDMTFRYIQQLRNHLESNHGISMLSEELHFPNMNAFESWKCEIERKFLCSYVLRTASQKNPFSRKLLYRCHRSGRYESKAVNEKKRKRKVKAGGSCKLGLVCTSAIDCLRTQNEVIVNYYPNHYGHGEETTFVQLSPEEELAIQESVSNGVPYEMLLDDILDNESKDTVQLLLLKKKDIRWINSAFQAEEFNNGISDAESVENWVRCCCKMEDSPVLFYQQKDIGSDQEEFTLVIMTEFQKHILSSAKKNVVCLDSLHRRKGGRFYLTLLFIMDECDNAFPVAFCISNKVDEDVIMQFLSAVKDSAGSLSFKYFMSDEEDYFYESWVTVMNDKPRWLWSIWYVVHKLQTQLNSVKESVVKRAVVYKEMRQIFLCQNEMVFKCMFKNFIDKLSNNPLTKSFSEFIVDNYGSNAEMWASCYRQDVGLSTNSYLEVMHRTFRYCCCEGRKKRVDKFLFVVMKLIKFKMLDRINTLLDKEKLNLANKAINMCHSAGLEIPTDSISALSEKIWLIQTGHDEGPLYVTKELEKCPEHCSLRCDDCDICVHQYSCTCVHSVVDGNLCMHVHAVVWKFTPHYSPIPSPDHSPVSFENDILLNSESESSSPDLFDDVLKETHAVYEKIKQNRCNLNKDCRDSIMKSLNEFNKCVDMCIGKKVERKVKKVKKLKEKFPKTLTTTPATTSETSNSATVELNPFVKGGPKKPFLFWPHPPQTFNNGAATQYVLLMPTLIKK